MFRMILLGVPPLYLGTPVAMQLIPHIKRTLTEIGA